MKRAAIAGAALGGLIGIIPAIAFAVLVVGYDESVNGSRADGAAGAYLVAVVLGGAIGAIIGLAAALAGAAVARSSSGDARSRRLKGAWTSAAVATAPMVLLSAFGPVLSVGIVLVVALAWTAAWVALPRVMDLEAAAETLPVQYGDPPAAAASGMSPAKRAVMAVLTAGVGGFLVTNVIMTVVQLPVSRGTEDVIGVGVLVVAAAAIGGVVWRVTSRGAH